MIDVAWRHQEVFHPFDEAKKERMTKVIRSFLAAAQGFWTYICAHNWLRKSYAAVARKWLLLLCNSKRFFINGAMRKKEQVAESYLFFFLSAAQGFEPRKWRSQSPLPYRLATPLRCIFCCTLRCGIYYSRKWGICQYFFESFCEKIANFEKLSFCMRKFAKRLYFLCK